jgi:hypothetical protein
VSDLSRTPARWSAQVASTGESVAEAAVFYFPGWTASIDGQEVPVDIAPQMA